MPLRELVGTRLSDRLPPLPSCRQHETRRRTVLRCRCVSAPLFLEALSVSLHNDLDTCSCPVLFSLVPSGFPSGVSVKGDSLSDFWFVCICWVPFAFVSSDEDTILKLI